VGGFLLAEFGIAAVFAFSVALLLPSLFAVRRIGLRRERRVSHPASFVKSLREGLAAARRDDRLAGVFLITIIFNVFGWPATSMVPVIGTDHLGLGPKGVGLLAACDGVGGLISALLVARVAPAASYARIYAAAVGLYFVMVICFAAAPVVAIAAAAWFVAGAFQALFAVMQTTLVYRAAPIEMRARLLGVLSVCIGTGPLGFLYLGFLGDLLGPRIATIALAAQGVVAMLATRRYWSATLRL